MKRAVFAAFVAALAVAVSTALAKSSSSISIAVSQKPVLFGFSTSVSGDVSGTTPRARL